MAPVDSGELQAVLANDLGRALMDPIGKTFVAGLAAFAGQEKLRLMFCKGTAQR
jgi:hypothetical protein